MQLKKIDLIRLNVYAPKIILTLLFILYIASSSFFAMKLNEGIIPDEPHHYQVSKLFSTTWGIPPDSPETVPFAGVNYKPFLFYWINARIINLLDLAFPTFTERVVLIILRLFGVLYSTIAVIFVYLFSKEIINNPWGQLFVVFLLTNTLMFTFLSGGLNYDTLFFLCSFAGIYYITRVFKGKAFYKNNVAWLFFILIGSLVKMTMLPLAAITVLLWVVYLFKNYHAIDFRVSISLTTSFVVLLCVSLIGLNLFIYGGSIIKYHTLTPSCTHIFTESQCENYRLYIRDKALLLENKLSFVDIMTGEYPDPIEYGLDYWPSLMLERIYGILGHRTYYPNITIFRLLFLWGIFLTIRYWEKPSFILGGAFIIFLFYLLVLFWTSYDTELFFGFKHVGIQGRYIFPVIGIFYTLLVYYYLKIPSNIIRILTFEFTTIIFIFYSPIIFLLRFYTNLSEWFM